MGVEVAKTDVTKKCVGRKITQNMFNVCIVGCWCGEKNVMKIYNIFVSLGVDMAKKMSWKNAMKKCHDKCHVFVLLCVDVAKKCNEEMCRTKNMTKYWILMCGNQHNVH